MARLARLVIPGLPHHVTRRGSGRAQTFFGDADDAFSRASASGFATGGR